MAGAMAREFGCQARWLLSNMAADDRLPQVGCCHFGSCASSQRMTYLFFKTVMIDGGPTLCGAESLMALCRQGSTFAADRLCCVETAGAQPALSLGCILQAHPALQLAVVRGGLAASPSPPGPLDVWRPAQLLYLQLQTDPPTWLGSLPQLAVLDLSGSAAVKMLPDSVSRLHSLRLLQLGSCAELRLLPDGIGTLTSLRHLDLASCAKLQRLPASIGSLSSLQRLDLSNCCTLEQLPDSISSLSSLRYLDVSRCPALEQLPAHIGSLSKLAVLHISSNFELQELPPTIGNLSSLQTLDIRDCHALQQLPHSISRLSGLEVRHSCVALQHLPGSVYSVPKQELRG